MRSRRRFEMRKETNPHGRSGLSLHAERCSSSLRPLMVAKRLPTPLRRRNEMNKLMCSNTFCCTVYSKSWFLECPRDEPGVATRNRSRNWSWSWCTLACNIAYKPLLERATENNRKKKLPLGMLEVQPSMEVDARRIALRSSAVSTKRAEPVTNKATYYFDIPG